MVVENNNNNNNNSRINDIITRNKSRFFAMKEMCKAKIIIKKSINSVINERNFLSKLNFPLLCNMYYAFQDSENLYIIMDYLSGGDLRYHLCRRNYFSEEESKFIAACIVLNLEYIHQNNIIHRDLKPENLVFDSLGYLHLTDFGIAEEYEKGKKIIVNSGTPGYMAPEVMINKPHDFCVDFFSLGVIIFECIFRCRPYNGEDRKQIKEDIISREIKLCEADLPEEFEDKSAANIINKLLNRKKSKRLGVNGVKEVKLHKWFSNINWEKIVNFDMISPFQFEKEDNFDSRYANEAEEEYIYEGKKSYYINMSNELNFFEGFYFNFEDDIKTKDNFNKIVNIINKNNNDNKNNNKDSNNKDNNNKDENKDNNKDSNDKNSSKITILSIKNLNSNRNEGILKVRNSNKKRNSVRYKMIRGERYKRKDKNSSINDGSISFKTIKTIKKLNHNRSCSNNLILLDND